MIRVDRFQFRITPRARRPPENVGMLWNGVEAAPLIESAGATQFCPECVAALGAVPDERLEELRR